MDNKMNTQQQYAFDYWHAGLVPIPLRLDGSKRPAIDAWQRWQTERPRQQQVTEWFAKPAGIGIVCGIVSGGVEVIDFDEPTLFGPIYDSLSSELRSQLSVYETPKGWHVIYRCNEIYKATKLARRPDKSTLIESRGEGSYIVAEGSPLRVHSSGIPYVHYMGPRLETLATIDPGGRREIWRQCIAYDQTGEPTPAVKLGRQLAERVHRERHPVVAPSIERARAYLSKMEPAIQGSDGSGACFRATCKLVGDFGLSSETAMQLLVEEYNPRCQPPWSERELQHKVADAIRKTGAV
jgi:hypothetical protein